MSSSDPERPHFLFVKVLASRGRLEAVTQQMGYHPQYLDSFLKTQHYLMHMDGPLPFDCRHYIAIMVSPAGSCRRGRGALLSPVRLPALPPPDSLCRRLLCRGQNHDVLEVGWRGGLGVPGHLSRQHSAGMLTCCSCRQLPGTSAGTW